MSKFVSQFTRLGKKVSSTEDEHVDEQDKLPNQPFSRRSFIGKGLTLGAFTLGAPMLSTLVKAPKSNQPTKGDVAILTFIAAAELLETDLYQQYNELGGIQDSEIPGGSGNKPYTDALVKIDPDIPQYIHDNADDERSHGVFLHAYLASIGVDPPNLDKFRTLPSSKATGAQQIGRLTNLMELNIDTSVWTRYRSSTKNPDLGDTFPPAIPGLLKGKFPAIPRDDNDLDPADHIQAIANTAVFHFVVIEDGGSFLLPSFAQRVSDVDVLRILLSTGPVEYAQFQTWHDKAGNAPPVTDPTNGLEFPDLNAAPLGGEDFATNRILPEPTIFNQKYPPVSILRPTNTAGVAVRVAKFLTAMGLFAGQPPEFFAAVTALAEAADAAQRV